MSEPDPARSLGRQFAVTWGLQTAHGGMTGAMLHRTRAFVAAGLGPVTVLTFDLRDDYPDVVAALRADGRLIDGIDVRNVWDDMSVWHERGAARLRGTKPSALDAHSPLGFDGSRTRYRESADGDVLQVDRYRDDGTLAWSDRRDTVERGRVGGRSVVLADRDGTPVSGFTSVRAFYRAWLDLVVGDEQAVLIVDSKTAAPVIAGYKNPRATRIHLLHNSHLVRERRPWDEVKASRRGTLADLAAFDAVVVLSERQRDDLDAMFSLGDRIEVIPNSASLPSTAPGPAREPGSGMAVGSLDARKRVDHAVDAVALARANGADVTLDVYGDGPHRADLEQRISATGLDGAVVLRGFDSDAATKFETHSFFMLTSVTEGFPLVLAEGMSRGCIPISYDIPYGPADIITDGVSGFLVDAGDVEALAERIGLLLRESDDEMERLRGDAMSAASAFTDSVVVEKWREAIVRACERRRGELKLTVTVRSARLQRDRRWRVTADFTLSGADVSPSDVAAAVSLHGVDRNVELRTTASVRRTLRHGVWRAVADFAPDSTAWLTSDVAVSAHLEIEAAGGRARVKLPPL